MTEEFEATLPMWNKMHSFKKTDNPPLTLMRLPKSNRLLLLNPTKSQYSIVIDGHISKVKWPDHALYAVAQEAYTIVHENTRTGDMKVPCCYASPTGYVKGTLEELETWTKLPSSIIVGKMVSRLVQSKLESVGYSGGKVYDQETN